MQTWIEGSIEGRYVYLTPSDDVETPRDRVFFARGGFGCEREAIGTKVMGTLVARAYDCYVRSVHVMGILTDVEAARVLKDDTKPTWDDAPDEYYQAL